MKAIEFIYQYRDASNYKRGDSIILDPGCDIDETGLKVLNEMVREFFDEGEYFIAEQIGVPEAFFSESVYEDDHCWHEFLRFDIVECEKVKLQVRKGYDPRTLEQFLADVAKASIAGWKDFDYVERARTADMRWGR